MLRFLDALITNLNNSTGTITIESHHPAKDLEEVKRYMRIGLRYSRSFVPLRIVLLLLISFSDSAPIATLRSESFNGRRNGTNNSAPYWSYRLYVRCFFFLPFSKSSMSLIPIQRRHRPHRTPRLQKPRHQKPNHHLPPSPWAGARRHALQARSASQTYPL